MLGIFRSLGFWLIVMGVIAGISGFWTGDKAMYTACTTGLTLGGIWIYFNREDRLRGKKPEVTMDGRHVKYVPISRK